MKPKDTGKKDPKQKRVTVVETAKKTDATKKIPIPTKKSTSKAKPSTTTTTTSKSRKSTITGTTSKTTKPTTSKATSKPKPELKKHTSRISIKRKTVVDPKNKLRNLRS